jgi:hypothetical protein
VSSRRSSSVSKVVRCGNEAVAATRAAKSWCAPWNARTCDPAPTQDAAAELLSLPSSTFRRHLTRGPERVVDWLRQRELHGGGA